MRPIRLSPRRFYSTRGSFGKDRIALPTVQCSGVQSKTGAAPRVIGSTALRNAKSRMGGIWDNSLYTSWRSSSPWIPWSGIQTPPLESSRQRLPQKRAPPSAPKRATSLKWKSIGRLARAAVIVRRLSPSKSPLLTTRERRRAASGTTPSTVPHCCTEQVLRGGF
jgi:hypothetical protein